MAAQGSRSRQPPNFADLGESLAVSAVVIDAETQAERLMYQWDAPLGSFVGTGQQVTWVAPPSASTPMAVTLGLRVVETYGPGGSLRHEVNRTHVVSLHDSPREVGDMSRRFLVEFSKPQTNQDWRDVMRDFDLDGRACPDPSLVASERNDVIYHYSNFFMHNYQIGPATTTVNFGQGCAVRNRPGDACSSVPAHWDSTDLQTGIRHMTSGIDYLAAVYSASESRWRLCSSDFLAPSQVQGHRSYTR
jgi:hypothetical protein